MPNGSHPPRSISILTRQKSSNSGDHVRFTPDTQNNRQSTASSSLAVPGSGNVVNGDRLRRRSSVAERIGSLGEVGGANSLYNFARSWQRAATFSEQYPPNKRSFMFQDDEEYEDDGEPVTGELDMPDEERGLLSHRDLLRAALNEGRRKSSDSPFEEDHEETSLLRTESSPEEQTFQVDPSLSSPFGGSYSAGYGTTAPRTMPTRLSTRASRRRLTENNPAPARESSRSDEREPLLVRKKEAEPGKFVDTVVGESTMAQTVFNSINVLVGVGMLSLPMAIRYSGWIIGVLFLIFSAFSTAYTSKLLAKCLDCDGSLITFADLGYVSFGSRARVAISTLFLLELFAACVALVVLFADSMESLFGSLGFAGVSAVTEYKILCGLCLVPLGFLPLRLLSFTSILGILSCVAIVVAILIDGIVKTEAPGSLRDPAQTYLLPESWKALPLSFGLLMAPWGGQSVFPNIYRDMRTPSKYNRSVNVTYCLTFLIEGSLAIIGYIMFGDRVQGEVTKNVFLTKGYPHWVTLFIVMSIAVIPLTKLPLNARPIVSQFEVFLRLEPRAAEGKSGGLANISERGRRIARFFIRMLVIVLFVVISILIPGFDRIMSLLGSFACFTVCIILPCSFHLKIFGKELTLRQRILDWTLIIFCSILAVLGTICAFIPKSTLGVAG